MDIKPTFLAVLQNASRALRALEAAHCDGGPLPVYDFPCLQPLLDELAEVTRLVRRRRRMFARRVPSPGRRRPRPTRRARPRRRRSA